MSSAAGQRAVLVIAHRTFRDEEYRYPREVLEGAGVEVQVASSETSAAIGKLGLEVQPDMVISSINEADFDAIVFVGGGGAAQYFDDDESHQLARRFHGEGKVVAAICIAPTILARAGLLDGKRVTSFESERDEIGRAGASYTGRLVERDGHIVTASGPEAARDFGYEIVRALEER